MFHSGRSRVLFATVTTGTLLIMLAACGDTHKPVDLQTGAVAMSVIWPVGTQPVAGDCGATLTFSAQPTSDVSKQQPNSGITAAPAAYTQSFVDVPPVRTGPNAKQSKGNPYTPPGEPAGTYVCVFHRPMLSGLQFGHWEFSASNNAAWSASCTQEVGRQITTVTFTFGKAACS